jgi:hypothetical protein
MARGHTTNDYGTTVNRSTRWHRPTILANHLLHWISSMIVLGISAYFIHEFSHNAHLIYWVTIVSVLVYHIFHRYSTIPNTILRLRLMHYSISLRLLYQSSALTRVTWHLLPGPSRTCGLPRSSLPPKIITMEAAIALLPLSASSVSRRH